MKVALFGAGRIGKIHASNLVAIDGVELKYIHDPYAPNAEALSAQTGAKIAGVEEIFADKEVDVVVIASSTDTHSDLLLKSAAAKKHVFCEKPIDLSLEKALLCEKAVKESGITCMLGFQRRFDPTFYSAKERILKGEIGTPEVLIITSRDPGAPPVEYLKVSGGIFRDMLIHDFDICRWILDDEIESVFAQASCLVDSKIQSEAGDYDTTAVTIKTKSGRLCQINTTRRAPYGYDQRFEVMGSKGLLQCHNHKPTEVQFWGTEAVSQDLPEHFFLERYRAAYRLEMEHFFDCVKNGKTPRTSISDGVQAQKLADAATESAKTGKIVYV